MILSFAWTTPAILARVKTVTRRDYSDEQMAKFKHGDLADAYDKLPRARGNKIGAIRIVSVHREPIAMMRANRAYAESEWKKEGGSLCWPTVEEFLQTPWKDTHGDPVRIEFEYLMTLNELNTALQQWKCGDHSCVVAPTKGMGTNGGCRCDARNLQMAVHLFRRFMRDNHPPTTKKGR